MNGVWLSACLLHDVLLLCLCVYPNHDRCTVFEMCSSPAIHNILNTAFFLAFYNDSRKHCQTRHCTSNEHVTNKALESGNRSRKLTLKQVIQVDGCTHCSHWYLIGQEFKQIPAILWKTVNKGVNRQFPAVLDNVYIHTYDNNGREQRHTFT